MKLALRILAFLVLLLTVVGAAVYVYAVGHLSAQLPTTAEIRDLKLQVPLRVYTADGKLMAEFGAERRAPLRFDQIPPRLVKAFLAAEDERFFEHPGVDYRGLLRAALKLAVTGEKTQGGSTITMQLARNYFLSSERSYERKAKEILLALRMERELTKQEILETYLNKIYLGERAYGVGAAAKIYFGKDVTALTLSEAAILAGLPKAPSRDNPVVNPERARERRDYVLRRMRELGEISDLEYQAALAEPIATTTQAVPVEAEAHYVAEMARVEVTQRFGEAAYAGGYRVTTTIDSRLQEAAVNALRAAVLDYEERHGFRGAEARVPAETLQPDAEGGAASVVAALDARPPIAGLWPAVVLEADKTRIRALTRAQGIVELKGAALEWAALSDKSRPKPGDVIRVRQQGQDWRLAQAPRAQAALVALDPATGAIRALVGGYDFFEGRFNRVVQARRQPGSGFKPFLYAAALAQGFTPASVLLDAPVVFEDTTLEDTWRPENYGGDFYGPTRLREALVHSRNLVSIRLLQAIGIDYARQYISQFGFPTERMPQNLTLALGSPTFTPLEMARGFAVLANNGFRVEPYFVDEIAGADGSKVLAADPAIACDSCVEATLAAAAGAQPASASQRVNGKHLAPRVLDPRVVYLITDMMKDVVRRGTATKAMELGRNDLAGKTGTTNDETDAWFNGFNGKLVASAWLGFDQPAPLGRGEVGGRAALPMWIDFMRVALKDVPEIELPRPPGLVNVRIDPATGKLAGAGSAAAIFEIVQAERIPTPDSGDQPQAEEDPDKATVEDLY